MVQRASRQRSLPDVVPAARLRFWIILAIAGAAEDEDPRHVSWTAPNQRDDRQPRPAARSWHRLMAHRHGSYCVGGSFSASGHRNTFPLAFSLWFLELCRRTCTGERSRAMIDSFSDLSKTNGSSGSACRLETREGSLAPSLQARGGNFSVGQGFVLRFPAAWVVHVARCGCRRPRGVTRR